MAWHLHLDVLAILIVLAAAYWYGLNRTQPEPRWLHPIERRPLFVFGLGFLVVGIFRLGTELLSWPIGLLAAAIVLTRQPFLNYGIRGYVDLVVIALVVWSAVLEASVDRSRHRIISAGLFDLNVVDAVTGLIGTHRSRLYAFPAVPFLHDTTTRNVIVTEEGIVVNDLL